MLPRVQGEAGCIPEEKTFEDTETATLPQKGPQLSDAEGLRMFEHVKLDPCAAPMPFLRNLQNPRLGLMETRHWAGLGMPQNDHSPTCHRCAARSHPLSSHMLASVHRPLS